MSSCGIFMLCSKKKNKNKKSDTVTAAVETDIEQLEKENLLVYKLQGGNEVNQVKKTNIKMRNQMHKYIYICKYIRCLIKYFNLTNSL